MVLCKTKHCQRVAKYVMWASKDAETIERPICGPCKHMAEEMDAVTPNTVEFTQKTEDDT
jgi:hydroxymethylpyrimidine/phosphomethylpyrimidine kinase